MPRRPSTSATCLATPRAGIASPGPVERRAGRPGVTSPATPSIARSTPRPGPAPPNVAFREPLARGRPDRSRPRSTTARPSRRCRHSDEQLARLVPAMAGRRGVIVAGARAALLRRSARCSVLAETLGWPVLADHLSGLRGPRSPHGRTFDPMLRATRRRRSGCGRQFVLHIGGLLASRVMNERPSTSERRTWASIATASAWIPARARSQPTWMWPQRARI